MLELRQTIVQALDASFDIAAVSTQAGNISDLDFASERAQLEAAKLALRAAEISVRQSREELNLLMGLWGPDPIGKAPDACRIFPSVPLETKDIERLVDRAQSRSCAGTTTNHRRRRRVGIDQVDDFAAGFQCRAAQRAQ